MFRTAIAAIVASLGLATAVEAHPPTVRYYPQAPVSYYPQAPVAYRPIRRVYEVQVRRCSHDRWQTFRATGDHDYAHDLARDLRRQGYQARVEH